MSEEQETLRVVAGDATPDELAALLAVVAARGTPRDAAGGDASGQVSLWARRSSMHRRTAVTPPEGPWRTSLWPR